MLIKLMKYEFKATARVMVPLCIIAVALASVTQITLWEFVIKVPGSDPNLVNIVLLSAVAAAMGAVLAASVVLIIQRFRSNLLGNEGHVMLTLPVSIHQHIWAKLLVSVLWFMVTTLVVFEVIMILCYNRTIWMAFPELQNLFLTRFSLGSTSDLSWGAATAMLFGATLVAAATLCLEIYAPLALGHSFHKHKGLLSVAFFLGFQVISHLVSGFGPYLTDLIYWFFPSQSPTGVFILDMGSSLVFSILWAVILYAITHYTLKHRLNLE